MVRLIGVNFPAPEYQVCSLKKTTKMDGLLLQLTHQLRRFSQLRRIKKSYRVKVLRCCNISEGWRGGAFFLPAGCAGRHDGRGGRPFNHLFGRKVLLHRENLSDLLSIVSESAPLYRRDIHF
jgi:hypothetical protein